MTAVPETLRAQLQSGVVLSDPDVEHALIVQAAKELGLDFFDIDCARAKSKSAVLRAIANALDFPEHFGNNLDALYDSLTDTLTDHERGLVIVLRGLHVDAPGLAEHVQALGDVFNDAMEYARENGRALSYVLEPAHDAEAPAE